MTSVTVVDFFAAGTPVGQGRISHGKHGRGYHSNGKTLLPWRKTVAAAAPSVLPLWDCPLMLVTTFWLPRPKSVRREAPCVRPDLSHLVRAVEDALTDVVWTDDARVVAGVAAKHYADDEHPSGVHVEVSVWEEGTVVRTVESAS